ncbi:MAG: hypothetical protein ACRD7E_25150 [Bryobacteraceae bacterium]
MTRLNLLWLNTMPALEGNVLLNTRVADPVGKVPDYNAIVRIEVVS